MCQLKFIPACGLSVSLDIHVTVCLDDVEGSEVVQMVTITQRYQGCVEFDMVPYVQVFNHISVAFETVLAEGDADVWAVSSRYVGGVHLHHDVGGVVSETHGVILVQVNSYDIAIPAYRFCKVIHLKGSESSSWVLIIRVVATLTSVIFPGKCRNTT